MEAPNTYNSDHCCYGCLCMDDAYILQNYELQNEMLKSVFGMERFCLCYVCIRMMQQAERFIQNVQSNQILLQNFNDKLDTAFQMVRSQTQPLKDLKLFYQEPLELTCDSNEVSGEIFTILHRKGNMKEDSIKFKMKQEDPILLSGNGEKDSEETISFISKKRKGEVDIKYEMKEESDELSYDYDDNFNAEDADFCENSIKEENISIDSLLKAEIDADDVDLKCLQKQLKTKKVKSKKYERDRDKTSANSSDIPQINYVLITREQCMEERDKMSRSKKYLNCLFKCETCVKGFNYKSGYDKHMEKHSESFGSFECDICKQRMPTEEKLQSHEKCHKRRFKCPVCGILRVSRLTIKDHYTSTHCFGYIEYKCTQCTKVFTRQMSLTKHISYAHKKKERVSCSYCHKTYANKEIWKKHMIVSHCKDEEGIKLKRHVCEECGAAFMAASQLRNHATKHSKSRDFYCVECDKSFKTDSVLQNHLKTASPHVNYLELPLPCQHCHKRFAIRRDLERHTNRVHLNIKPYQCDMCEKAYVNGWSLNHHKKLVHEGYKRPLIFACSMCDKVFDRKQILKGHIRTHTGERPYQCKKCPAQFSQASSLGTHVKLIHLKLTRDGKPKPASVK